MQIDDRWISYWLRKTGLSRFVHRELAGRSQKRNQCHGAGSLYFCQVRPVGVNHFVRGCECFRAVAISISLSTGQRYEAYTDN